jgi:hypothetical protein
MPLTIQSLFSRLVYGMSLSTDCLLTGIDKFDLTEE